MVKCEWPRRLPYAKSRNLKTALLEHDGTKWEFVEASYEEDCGPCDMTWRKTTEYLRLGSEPECCKTCARRLGLIW